MAQSGDEAAIKVSGKWAASAERLASGVRNLSASVEAATRKGASPDAMQAAISGLMATAKMMSTDIAAWNRSMGEDAVFRTTTSDACIKSFFNFIKQQFLTIATGLERTAKMM